MNLKSKIKPWYAKEHPDDYQLDKINPEATFEQVYKEPWKVYDIIGEVDSMIREEVFAMTSELADVDYDDIYLKWLHGDKKESKEMKEYRKKLETLFKKGKACTVNYLDKKGESKQIDIVPDKDTSIVGIIMECKTNVEDFFKLESIGGVKKESKLNESKENNAIDIRNTIQEELTDEERAVMYNKETNLDLTDMDEFWDWLDGLDQEEIEDLGDKYLTEACKASKKESKDVLYKAIIAEAKKKLNPSLFEVFEKEIKEKKFESKEDFNKLLTTFKLNESTKLEETKSQTLYDYLEEHNFEDFDICDNEYDMMVAFCFDVEDADKENYDRYLAMLAKSLKVIDAGNGIITVDMANYVRNNYDALESIFDLSGQDKEECIAELVSDIMPGVISGYTTDSVYSELCKDIKTESKTLTEADSNFEVELNGIKMKVKSEDEVNLFNTIKRSLKGLEDKVQAFDVNLKEDTYVIFGNSSEQEFAVEYDNNTFGKIKSITTVADHLSLTKEFISLAEELLKLK